MTLPYVNRRKMDQELDNSVCGGPRSMSVSPLEGAINLTPYKVTLRNFPYLTVSPVVLC